MIGHVRVRVCSLQFTSPLVMAIIITTCAMCQKCALYGYTILVDTLYAGEPSYIAVNSTNPSPTHSSFLSEGGGGNTEGGICLEGGQYVRIFTYCAQLKNDKKN